MPAKTIAYFCAEFGIDSNTPTYAGGLGILAGDTMKEAADRDYPMIGIGLLYRGQYFIQRVNQEGWQTEDVSLYDPISACLRQVTTAGTPMYLTANFAGEEVYIKSYRVRVGDNTTLYFLNSDSHKNSERWRGIMSADYWGDHETQLMQQLVLGIGGMKLLEALKIEPEIYHFNEGRPCFVVWQLIIHLMKKLNLNFDQASEEASKRIVYTNHTLLRAGNIRYELDLVKKYANSFAGEMGIDTDKLLEKGKVPDSSEFGITEYSMNFASKVNSVSEPHKSCSEREWPEYKWINITNGVHFPSWQNTHFRDPGLSHGEVWQIHNMRKLELMKVVERRSGFGYDHDRLIIGWARRLAGYKQLAVLFENVDRLAQLLKREGRQVQLLVAGKAHPGDEEAKKNLQVTLKHFGGELAGNAIFAPNYDIALARSMVSGVDLWLNTPQFGKEACGTSGMKAISNGVPSLSVNDGWVSEVSWEGVGWILDHERLSSSLYEILEGQIIPMFYNRNSEELPWEWIDRMKASMKIAQDYSTERMFDQYIKYLYS